MFDELPSGGVGRGAVGSWGALLFAAAFGLAASGALYWLLSEAWGLLGS